MKLLISFSLVLCCCSVCFSQQSFSTARLTATQGNYSYVYSLKQKHVIHYSRDGKTLKIKGFVTALGMDSIVVYNPGVSGQFNKIAVVEIQKIKTPHPGFRNGVIVVMAAGVLAMVVDAPLVGHNHNDNGYLFAGGLGATLIGAMVLPLTYATDKASERRSKGGWIFAIK